MVTEAQPNSKAVATVTAKITRGRPENDPLVLTIDKVRREISREPSLTEMEIIDFLNFCQAEQVDPFRKEIYLVKIPSQPAYYVIAIQTYLKMAEDNPNFKGYEAGVFTHIKDNSKPIQYEGELFPEGEILIGGWARVWRKDREKPIYAAVNLREYVKRTREGKLTRFWEDQPASMIRKIALSHAIKEAFPNRFTLTVTDAEFSEVKEDELPEPFMKDNAVEWRKVYAKLGEMGITHDDACQMLKIKSIKEDWIDKGQTIGDFVETIAELLAKTGRIVSAKQEEEKANIQTPTENEPTIKATIIDKITVAPDDDILFPETATVAPEPPPEPPPSTEKDNWADARTLIEDLRKTTHPKIEDEIKDRLLNFYHLRSPLPKGIRASVELLALEHQGNFYKWLGTL